MSGDEWRRIHWQASARTGVLQTRINQPIVTRQLLIFIDVKGFSTTEQKEQFESFLSVIASIAVAYHEREVWIGHTSNGLDHKGRRMETSLPTQTIMTFLDSLVKITPNPAYGTAQLLYMVSRNKHISAPIYFFCDTILEEHHRWLERNLKKAPFITFYYLRETPFSSMMRDSAKKLESFLSTFGLKGSGT